MNVNKSFIKHAFYNVHIYSIYFVLKKEMVLLWDFICFIFFSIKIQKDKRKVFPGYFMLQNILINQLINPMTCIFFK